MTDWSGRMVIIGRADITADAATAAVRQLRLRYRQAAMVSGNDFEAGFTVIAQDVIPSNQLAERTSRSAAWHRRLTPERQSGALIGVGALLKR